MSLALQIGTWETSDRIEQVRVTSNHTVVDNQRHQLVAADATVGDLCAEHRLQTGNLVHAIHGEKRWRTC